MKELEGRVALLCESEEVVVEDELEEGVTIEDEELLTRVDQDIHPPGCKERVEQGDVRK